MFSIISDAFAQGAVATSAAAEPSPIMNLVPLILIFVVFYFLMIRPHQKRLAEHHKMLDALKKGDKVVTGGGIIGTVIKVEGDEVQVEIAENVKVKVSKPTISGLAGAINPSVDSKAKSAKPKEVTANDR